MTAGAAGSIGSSERMAELLETLELTPMQKELLRSRWLSQVAWMSRQASRARSRYLWVRLPVVIGSVLIPGFVTILLGSGGGETLPWLFGLPIDVIRLLSFVTSLGVAVLAAVEEVMHFGERWRHYRRVAELLKTLGWQYLMLSGSFRRYESHSAAFAAFTERVEDTLNEDVQGYLGAMSGDGPGRSRHEFMT